LNWWLSCDFTWNSWQLCGLERTLAELPLEWCTETECVPQFYLTRPGHSMYSLASVIVWVLYLARIIGEAQRSMESLLSKWQDQLLCSTRICGWGLLLCPSKALDRVFMSNSVLAMAELSLVFVKMCRSDCLSPWMGHFIWSEAGHLEFPTASKSDQLVCTNVLYCHLITVISHPTSNYTEQPPKYRQLLLWASHCKHHGFWGTLCADHANMEGRQEECIQSETISLTLPMQTFYNSLDCICMSDHLSCFGINKAVSSWVVAYFTFYDVS
jgi:hypothetical protein